jgi:SAM-dependent methyltransferase
MIPVSGGAQTYWDDLARSYWMLESPLRPTGEELLSTQQVAMRHAALRPAGPFRALLLGVTPDLARMQWPENTKLFAVDHSFPMVKVVWPGNIPEVRHAICGDWLAMPLADSSCNLAIGDGSMNCVRYPDGFRKVAASVARALRPDGLLVLRCYAQLEQKEDPDRVLASLSKGDMPSFHYFKFRLLMALQEDAREGVAVADVYRCWVRSGIDPARLAASRGWDPATIRTLDLYRDSSTVHTFPTLAECRSVLREYFDEVSCSYASFPLAERCPMLVLKPIPDAKASGSRRGN